MHHLEADAVSGWKAGQAVDDWCAACKCARGHTVLAETPAGANPRVVCGYCGSQHNFRGRGTATVPESRVRETREITMEAPDNLEALVRRIFREECGLTPVAPADKWRGGELVLRPGRPGLQEKSQPIETFFHKIVMLRNRLRVLEQQINALEIPEDEKVRLQGYVTGCYGSLTSFNVLFAEENDRFKGSGAEDRR
jgi:hypothetical protein